MEPPPGFPDTGAQNPITHVFASVPDSLKGPLPPEFPDVNNQHRHERTEKAGNKEAAEQVQCLLHGLFYLGIEIPKPSDTAQFDYAIVAIGVLRDSAFQVEFVPSSVMQVKLTLAF